MAPGLSDFYTVFIFGEGLKSFVRRPNLSSQMSKKCQGQYSAFPFLRANLLLTHAGQRASASHWNVLQSMPTGVDPACRLGLLLLEPEILIKSVAIGVTCSPQD